MKYCKNSKDCSFSKLSSEKLKKTKFFEILNTKFLTLLVLLLSSFISISAHGDGDGHEETEIIETKTTWDYIMPFSHFSEGQYFSGIIVIIFWFLLIKGFFELIVITFSKTIKIKTKK